MLLRLLQPTVVDSQLSRFAVRFALNVQDYPHYLALLGREPSKSEWKDGKVGLHFNIFPFISAKYGPASHMQSLIKFLFTINEEFRKVCDSFSTCVYAGTRSEHSKTSFPSLRTLNVISNNIKKNFRLYFSD